METLAPVDYLHFAVVRERGETMYNIVSRAYQSSGEISLTPGDRITGEVDSQGTSRKSQCMTYRARIKTSVIIVGTG